MPEDQVDRDTIVERIVADLLMRPGSLQPQKGKWPASKLYHFGGSPDYWRESIGTAYDKAIKPRDGLARYGADVSSAERWKNIGPNYAIAIDGPYHHHRLSVIRALVPKLDGRAVDFGCGEGALLKTLKDSGASEIIGIDPDQTLLEMARGSADQVVLGGVEKLSEIQSADFIMAANVLAFMTSEEEALFYKEAQRLLAPGGQIVITHSNDLFDMFTLNALTVDFFKRNFGTDPASLLTKPNRPDKITYNVRENPLSYPAKMAAFGFRVEQTEFINFHPVPPLLSEHDSEYIYNAKPRIYRDTLSFPPDERWKLMFQCSMFGVRARRVQA